MAYRLGKNHYQFLVDYAKQMASETDPLVKEELIAWRDALETYAWEQNNRVNWQYNEDGFRQNLQDLCVWFMERYRSWDTSERRRNRQIYADKLDGLTAREIAEKYDLKTGTVYGILRKMAWFTLEGERIRGNLQSAD